MGTLKIHTDNILPIIKKWLYSEKEIFVRELVSNASDALNKCRILRDRGELAVSDEELHIEILIDRKARTLKIIDTGIGMTAEEVEKYIAQVAFSGAEAFVDKYQAKEEKDQIIGHFGLGFYSAYMVAARVTIDTLSYLPESKPAFWSCDGSTQYELGEGQRTVRGTEITLHLDAESDEFLEESRLREILRRHCLFFPYPITLSGHLTNPNPPLWSRAASDCSDKEYIAFYHELYPADPDPLFWVHLNIDYPFRLRGILYFPKPQKRFEVRSSGVKLFCNRVFITDQCKDLMPDHLTILQGAIDSPDIPLNVSRSALQVDRTVRQLASHISKKLLDRLSALYTNERQRFLDVWPDISIVLKLGTLQEEKFYERAKELLLWKTLQGEWTTLEAYLERHGTAYGNKIFYTMESDGHLLDLYRDKGIEVLCAEPIDAALFSFLENRLRPAKCQRVDGGLDAALLDVSREKTLLDADGKTHSARLAAYIRSVLAADSLTVEAKSLDSSSLPALILFNEEQRRLRDTMQLMGQTLPASFDTAHTLVVNTNHALVCALYDLREKNPELSKEMVHHLYELALLSQKELLPSALSAFASRSHRLLASLIEQTPPSH